MVAVENLIFGPAIALNGVYAGDLSVATLNDTNNAEALILQIPKDGSITKIGLNVFNITGNPPAYNFAVTTVDSGTGYPTQTAYGGSSIESEDFTTTGWKWIDLTTPATATRGDFVAIHIWPGGTAPDVSNYIRISAESLFIWQAIPNGFFYGTAWGSEDGPVSLAFQYDDGTIVGFPVVYSGGVYFDSDTTPDEIGSKFSIPVDAKCVGARFQIEDAFFNGEVDVVLYDSSDTILTSCTIPNMTITDGYGFVDVVFDSEVQLTASQTYRLTVKPANASSDVILNIFDFPSATERVCSISESSRWYETSRTDGGAWTDNTSSIVWMALILSDISSGTGTPGTGSSEWGYVG